MHPIIEVNMMQVLCVVLSLAALIGGFLYAGFKDEKKRQDNWNKFLNIGRKQ